MKKLLTISLTIFMSLSLVIINTKDIKAEEANAACTTSSTGECSISSMNDLSAWATNTNDNVTGKLKANITLINEVTVSKIKTLDLNGYTIKAQDNFVGRMFLVEGSLVINDFSSAKTGAIDGGFSNKHTHNYEIICFETDNENSELTINGGTIKNFNNKYKGGAIYNFGGASVYINGGTIENCYSKWWGGAICNIFANLTITDGTIKNCSAGEIGGAIYCLGEAEKGSFEMSGGTIKDSSSPFGAISIENLEFHMKGNIKLDNSDDLYNKSDICLLEDGKIVVDDGFTQNNNSKIAIWTSIGNFLGSNEYEAVKKGTYTGNDIDKYFISGYGQEYIVKKIDTLALKGVTISEQPNFENGYKVNTTDDNTNPIEVYYQWYQSPIEKETQIGYQTTSEETYYIGNNSFKVTKEIFTSQPDGSWISNNHKDLLSIEGLKKRQILSFDYEVTSGTSASTYIELNVKTSSISSDSYCMYIGKNSSGKYSVEIPEDGLKYLVKIDITDSNGKSLPIKVSNIYVKERQDAKKIDGATSNIAVKAEQGADNFCKVYYVNTKDGSIGYENSYDTMFGKVLIGDHQKLLVGTNKDIYAVLDKSAKKDYLDVENMKIYVDGVKDTNLLSSDNYSIIDNPINVESVTLTLNGSYISKLSPGNHTFFIKMSDKEGYECTVLNLTIYTPSPDPEDKSCEKVIGPTWHWNNKKEICEDTGVVKTYTR